MLNAHSKSDISPNVLIGRTDFSQNSFQSFHTVILSLNKFSCYPVVLRSNTAKIEPFLEIGSDRMKKNMFYNIFLDISQEKKGTCQSMIPFFHVSPAGASQYADLPA